MTRWLFLTLFVLSSGPAYGGWVSLGEDENEGLAIYIDPATMSRQDDLVTMQILYDFKTPQAKEGSSAFRSASMKRQYNCTKEETRILDITNYAENMGEGEIVSQRKFETAEWAPVGTLESGTIAKDLWTLGCR